jgi:hypothetical protein
MGKTVSWTIGNRPAAAYTQANGEAEKIEVVAVRQLIMGAKHTIILYGNSLFVVALEAVLKDQPEVDLVCVAQAAEDDGPRLAALEPTALICEAASGAGGDSGAIARLISQLPDVLVIELNLEHSTVTFVTRRQQDITRAADIVKTITERQHPQPLMPPDGP